MRRRIVVTVLGVLLLAAAGCSSQVAAPSAPPVNPSAVLGSTSSGDVAQTPAQNGGIRDHSYPRDAFAGKPSANLITVATGDTAVSAEAAAQAARPTEADSQPTIHLVSAVHVTLPAAFVASVTSGKSAKETSAWAVTYTGVPLKHALPAPNGSPIGQGTIRVGDRTVLVDAETGAIIASDEYATP